MTKFWQLLQDSVITQAAITLCLIITVCYLEITGRPVSDLLGMALMAVLGFYFGSKSQQVLNRAQARD